eukprot:gene6926-7144_t
MNGLDGLKALLQKKRQETQDLVGDKKYVRKSKLEEAKLKRLREEEEQERRAKEEKKRRLQGTAPGPDGRPSTPVDAADTAGAAAAAGTDHDAISPAGAAEAAAASLPKEEVIRRLRALRQPVTLFGEEDADRLARLRKALPIEERMIQLLQSWCKQWEDDLEARSDEVKLSGMGNQATMVFKQSMTYFEPLYERLRKRQLQEELKLAIGNAPWPIGVTHVGLHERSAREKISHVMNSSSQAHIMNDEATRKYFQRLRPTDPSRSVDFDVHGDEGRGSAGAGSNRQALLEAQAKGELPLALPAAPHSMAPDGSVKIPPKWEHVLKQQIKQVAAAKTPPKTPPRSPLLHQQ